MHNKRLGRDDVLKIEVGLIRTLYEDRTDFIDSGPVRHLQHPGVLILAVTRVQVAAVSALPVEDDLQPPLAVAEATTPLGKTIAASATTTAVIECGIGMIVLEAPMIVTAK